ncbi:unnamed protein product [Acanthoscelides obtectus]|uniref:Uncharacterized protein n=1 Tax=Acanthoscelides obtectus TaxID=200917 RepID=A0A9P0K416_ACAOB|nr:unnamed protein product [Acanthoscelides obtectus]CAK1620235.1 hypothetical protein AOBTE_LOCUS255 [Acanthoscelides obtectus]
MEPKKDMLSKLQNYRNQAAVTAVQLWKAKGEAEAYAEETEKLRILSGELRKRIAEVERETKEFEPLVKIAETTLQSLRQTMEINSMSIIIHKEHEKCVTIEVRQYKQKVADILDKYSTHIEERKEELANDNPKCKILHEKLDQKKKVKFTCMSLEQQIRLNRRKKETFEDFARLRIVCFAKTWLDRKMYEERNSVLSQLITQKREVMCKLMEVTEKLQYKQKMRYIKDTSYTSAATPHIVFSQPADTKPVPKKTQKEKKDSENKEPVKEKNNPFDGLQFLLEKTTTKQLTETKPSLPAQPRVTNASVPMPKSQSHVSKVVILDNQLLKPPESPQPNPSLIRAEKSKERDAKLQKVLSDFKRKISHHTSIEVPKKGQYVPSIEKQDAKRMKCNIERNKKDVVPSQESMLYSQEEHEMRFVSQQSETAENKPNQQDRLDVNQNETLLMKPNKRKVTFADESILPSESFFRGGQPMETGMVMNKGDHQIGVVNMNNDALKSSENEYMQFSMSFGGKMPSSSLPNFGISNNGPGLFKKPSNPIGNDLKQSRGLNLGNEPESNMDVSFNYGDVSGFNDTGDYDASVMLSPTDDYQSTGSAISKTFAFNFRN